MTTPQALAAALREGGSAKEVGRLAGRSWRTVERWQRGETEPPASVLVQLMQRSRAIASAVAALAGLTPEIMDAEEARLIHELAELRFRRRLHVANDRPKGPADLVAKMAMAAAQAGLKPAAAAALFQTAPAQRKPLATSPNALGT